MNPSAPSAGRWAAAAGWSRAHPYTVDVALAAAITALSLVGLLTAAPSGSEREADALGVILVLLACVAFGWRRRAALRSVTVITALVIAFWVLDYSTSVDPVSLLSVYAAAAHGANRRRTWQVVGFCVAALTVTAILGVIIDEEDLSAAEAVGVGVTFTTSAVVGEVVYSRRQRLIELEARAERAEAEREANARQAVVDERSRIARELHDVVAHGMSVMVVQAGAARRVLRSDPDRATEALATIEETGRTSLTEMRRLLGVLRGSGDGDTRTPQPRLADIDALVAQAKESGVETALAIIGECGALPAGVELAGYRLVQEALTNVIKHAGRASAHVVVTHEVDRLGIEITDDGLGGAAPPGAAIGHGLIGMRERVEIYGGTFEAGPHPGGGYRVRAMLPVDPSWRPARVASS